ncbi:hypothetical protein AVEN_81784-1 [Araneus ventricosus]|uniref:Uncharacterized protein n=1 Tax=Araneus ventricosus TaxID=182803 RepID=A0A4Y2JF90_ARAVE|nr:hypothetical protein AVEN_81784-1 [Araneus ventricosus]
MTSVEPFGNVAQKFAGQQETRFFVRLLVRSPQAFIASLFQAFQKDVKSPPSADKIELLFRTRAPAKAREKISLALYSYRRV